MLLNLCSLLLVSLFSINSYAYLDHASIVEKLIDKDREVSSSKVLGIKLAPLDKVVPKHLQQGQKKYFKDFNEDFKDVASKVDLRNRDTEVVRQVGPRCSAYGLVASMENLIGMPDKFRLSPSHLFIKYLKYSSEKAIKTALRSKITEHKYWPHYRRWIPKWGFRRHAKSKLTSAVYINNDVKKAVQALDAGRPVYIGMSVTKSMARCDAAIDPKSSPTGGGHAVSISGYGLDPKIEGGGYFILKNSWGKKCGDNGYQYLPFGHCMKGDPNYCIMWDIKGVRSGVRGVPSVFSDKKPFELKDINLEVTSKKVWYTKKRVVSVNVSGAEDNLLKIKEVHFSLDNQNWKAKRFVNSKGLRWSFKTKRKSHRIHVQYVLHDGKIFKKDYLWF